MIAYTDGACCPNPGHGGWGFVLVSPSGELVKEHSGSEPDTTNNRMEYLALIRALELYGAALWEIRTDSQLLVDTCMTWRHGWKKKGWKKKKNSDKPENQIKNLDLVQRIDALLDEHSRVTVTWVKGHNGNKFNEMADRLADNAARGIK